MGAGGPAAVDGAGNATILKGAARTFNPNTQLTGTGFAWDLNGNPTSYQEVACTWDVEDRLTATGTTFSAGYRGGSVRAWKNAGGSTPKTYFLYDGTRPVVELDAAGGVTAVNTFGANGLLSRRAGMVHGTLGTSVYYSFDASGNVVHRMGNGPVEAVCGMRKSGLPWTPAPGRAERAQVEVVLQPRPWYPCKDRRSSELRRLRPRRPGLFIYRACPRRRTSMDGYDVTTYGQRVADVYDGWYPEHDGPAIDLLAALAGDGRALELGIGTGRIALPLAARGVEVHGIDASEAMVAKLRAKPGGAELPVVLGDFADVGAEGPFSLVFVLFNTFFGLLSQEDQVRCFGGVGRQLAQDGVFVLEVFVPDLTRFVRGQNIQTSRVEADRAVLDVSRHDPVTQRVSSHHVELSESGARLYPVQIRYAWPSELDLMARLAGLRLRHRWSGWRGEPFSAGSEKHVSVYERDDGQ
jgi:SAM-dependent methyltransferase